MAGLVTIMSSLLHRLHNWLFGKWFRLTTSDAKSLDVRRGWEGSLWMIARDDCYEIALQISAEDADKILGWLRDSRTLTGMEKRRGIKLVQTLPISSTPSNTGRGSGNPK